MQHSLEAIPSNVSLNRDVSDERLIPHNKIVFVNFDQKIASQNMYKAKLRSRD